MKRVFNDILDFLSTFRGKVVMSIVVLAIGCAAGIASAQKAVHEAKITQNELCWNQYNNRVVLRALIANPPTDYGQIEDPELRQVIVASQEGGKAFKEFGFNLLAFDEACDGDNPRHIPEAALDLAGVPKEDR